MILEVILNFLRWEQGLQIVQQISILKMSIYIESPDPGAFLNHLKSTKSSPTALSPNQAVLPQPS